MKKILVTGGLGFIGSHFVHHIFKNTNWDIYVIDGLSYAGQSERLEDVMSKPRVKVFWHDLRSPINNHLKHTIGDIDYVVNFAAESHVDASITDPIPFVQNNVNLMLNIMQYSLDVSAEKFLHVSTDEVFGPALQGQKFTEWDVYKPSNPYSASKASQDHLAFSFWRTYGLPLLITNAMNNFGQMQNPEKFIPMSIKSLKEGINIMIHADTTTEEIGSRFWLHARNHSDAIMYLLHHVTPVQFPERDVPDRFNVVGDVELNNLEIVERIADISGCKMHYNLEDFHTQRPGHDLRYALDGMKMKKLGWIPPVRFDESFEKTILWTLNHPEWLY